MGADHLAELGLKLGLTTPPVGNYLPAVVEGNLIFCAGATCMIGGNRLYYGKVGVALTRPAFRRGMRSKNWPT